MADSEKICLSQLKETYKKGLLIPEIQRDYVMGAGGRNGANKDKLTSLLDAILEKYEAKENFDFSCIITYCKNNDFENNYLEIYDGQQRLTTLTLLTLFKLQKENNPAYRNYKNWYQFSGRPVANSIIDMLASDGFEKERIEVADFSSFSMKNLLDKFAEAKYNRITSDYLLHCVRFDRVEIGSQNEIEQFFMDLNSGVKLKDYELYKAKLIHYIGRLKLQCRDATSRIALDEFPHKLDNEWLNAFKPFASFTHPAEEYEILWLQYCLRMLCKDYGIGESKDRITGLTEEVLTALYRVMENVATLNPKNDIHMYSCWDLLKYSWDFCCRDRRGAFYSLEFTDYEALLYVFIRDVLLKKENTDAMQTDVLIWCYVTTLDWYIDYQNEYLRIIKLLLNHNVLINDKAWYASQDDGQSLYYSKYCVYGIPDYYGMHINIAATSEAKRKMQDIFNLHAKVITGSVGQKLLNAKKVSEVLMDIILACESASDEIVRIITARKELVTDMDYSEYVKKETEVLGIISRVSNPVSPGYYMARVKMSWPTRGATSEYPEDVWVLLQSKYDLLYASYVPVNDTCVQKFVDLFESRNDFFDKNKCFWISASIAYRIHNRPTKTAKTYAKYNSETECWAYRFTADGGYAEV